METGKKEFEFSVGSCGISAVAVDKTGKRQELAKHCSILVYRKGASEYR